MLRTILEAADVPGVAVLREQVQHARVVGGSPTFLDLDVGDAEPASAMPDGPLPARAYLVDPTGDCVGELLVWIDSGRLSALEYAWYTDSAPSDFPPMEWIRFEAPRNDDSVRHASLRSSAGRVTLGLLAGSVFVLMLACTAIPVHVSLGAGSLRCGTVIAPDRGPEVGDLCPDAAKHHLRAAAGLSAALVALAFVPLALARSPWAPRRLVWTWLGAWVALAVAALLWLATAYEYAPRHVIVDL